MKLSPFNGSERTGIVAALVGSFAMMLMVLPMSPAAYAAPSVLSTDSSLNCENNDSLFSSSFSCSLTTTAGNAIIVFFGCLSGPVANCNNLSVVDSQNNTYHFVTNVQTSCSSDNCEEFAFWGTASSTGPDEITFASAGRAYLGGDVYDVSGMNTSGIKSAFGGSDGSTSPGTFAPLTPYPNGFVASGVIANDASEFEAGPGYTLIPGQPCYSCGMSGGWQGSEYQMWGNASSTTSPFDYPPTNAGWAELALSLAPNIATTSVTCAPSPVTVTMSSECTATVTGAFPTGTVTWATNGTGKFSQSSCSLSEGECSVSYTPSVPASPVMITASYGGDSNNPVSSDNYSLSVMKSVTTNTVKCSPSPIVVGAATTCTASVSGVSPTGTITWASSGVADFSPATTCTLSAGSCAVDYTPSSTSSPITITAIYGGDGDNTGSSGTFTLAVGAISSSTSSSSTSSTASVSTSSTHSTASTATSSSNSQSTVSIKSSVAPSSSSSSASSSSVSWSYSAMVAINVTLLALSGLVVSRRKGRRPL
jgi:hypothetical protein